MVQVSDLEIAESLGLHPGLDEDELRQVYRRLVRRFHPDVTGDVDRDIMCRINAAYDAASQEGAKDQTADESTFASVVEDAQEEQNDAPSVNDACDAADEERDGKKTDSGLVFTAELRRVMEEMVLVALDDWLELKQGLPREEFLRRIACFLRLRRQGERPALHLPERCELHSDCLHVRYPSPATAGANILVFPGVCVDDGAIKETGKVRVILSDLTSEPGPVRLSSTDARSYGFDLQVDGCRVPVELHFDPAGQEAGAALCDAHAGRYRGLFA